MSLMVGKNRHLSIAIFSHKHLVVRLKRISLPGTNALAYFICNIIDLNENNYIDKIRWLGTIG